MPRSSIIYQNAERDITLIDIPTSIAASQCRTDVLLSTSPLEAPIEPKEDYRPKTQKAQASKAQKSADNMQHAEYKALVEHALTQIHVQVSGRPWCSPRQLMAQKQPLGKKVEAMEIDDPEKELESRMREWAASSESKGDETAFNLQRMMATLGATSEDAETAAETVPHKWITSYQPARESTSSAQQAAEAVSQVPQTSPWTSTFHNPFHHALALTISENAPQATSLGPSYRFTIPPRSTVFVSDSTASEAFRTSFRALTDEYTLPRHFDLVLLDPPWPNRSAKRKGAYEQVGGMPYLKKMLLNMDIDSYLEHNALVGVWITNKAALREHVLGPGGLFETWNVGLVEEWVWIKTTTKGELMFDIDTELRKPYEILLLGRAAPNSWTTMAHKVDVKRRVIAAVPDIHSRKPCLKELLEPYLLDPTDYSALEVFSRYLVSGWMSWGNEVLKFNWDDYWVEDVSSAEASFE